MRKRLAVPGYRMAGYLRLATVALLLIYSMNSVLIPASSFALPLASRTLRIADVSAGAVTSHQFTFSYVSSDAIGSISFEYCTSPLPEISCVAPTGLDTSAALLSEQSGEVGYTVVSATANKIVLGRVPALVPTNNPSSYTFDTIQNPTGPPGAFYVRIGTYATSDGSGPETDFGAVVNATTTGIALSTEVPPILKFCVGITLDNDCTTADESVVDVGDLTTARVAKGSSQMVAATNAEFGLAIGVYGTTMTSGNNVIPALTSPTVSAPGNAQFGLNLRANTNPDVGEEPSGIGVAAPTTNYNIPNRYMFESGSVIATSSVATDTRKFTASYIVNISPNQPPGVYTATLTYICTATF